MKLFILGAGYVGKALLTKRPQGSYTFFASTTSEENASLLRPFALEVFVLKAHETEKLKRLIDASDGICVFIAPKKDQNHEIYLETARTLAKILENRKTPFHLIYTGSTFVYEGAEELSDETTTLTPTHPNANILLETEETYLGIENPHVRTCILRLGGLYGPGRELVNRAKQLSNKVMPGTGNELTNHIHLDDVVSAVEFCLNNQLASVFNLVNDAHPSRKNLYDNLCHSLDIPPPIWDKTGRPNHGCGFAVSNKKIKDLGFVFSHPSLDN